MPRVRRGSSEPTKDVSEVSGHGAVVSQLRPYSSRARLGDVPRRKEVGRLWPPRQFRLKARPDISPEYTGVIPARPDHTMTATQSVTCWRRLGNIMASSPHRAVSSPPIDRVHAHQSLLPGCDRSGNAGETGLRLFDDLAAVIHDALAPFGVPRARDRDHLHVLAPPSARFHGRRLLPLR